MKGRGQDTENADVASRAWGDAPGATGSPGSAHRGRGEGMELRAGGVWEAAAFRGSDPNRWLPVHISLLHFLRSAASWPREPDGRRSGLKQQGHRSQ